ncbi:MAG: Nif11-like leader peptide family natural product precursor [Candidatus Rokuibacteriota bacterium]
MAKQGLEGFHQKVLSDPALQARLRTAADESSFLQLAVELGKEHGYHFTADDIRHRLAETERGEAPAHDPSVEVVGYGTYGGSIWCGYCKWASADDRLFKMPR